MTETTMVRVDMNTHKRIHWAAFTSGLTMGQVVARLAEVLPEPPRFEKPRALVDTRETYSATEEA